MPSFRTRRAPKLSKNVKNAKFQDAASPKLGKNVKNAKFQDATRTGTRRKDESVLKGRVGCENGEGGAWTWRQGFAGIGEFG